MANPRGNIGGYTDPSTPGWQRAAFDRVKARQKKVTRTTERTDGVSAVFDPPFRVLLDEACARRGISLAGYCRRALTAFVTHDLGLPMEEGAQHMPYPLTYKQYRGGGALIKTNDDGTGYGEWVIRELSDK